MPEEDTWTCGIRRSGESAAAPSEASSRRAAVLRLGDWNAVHAACKSEEPSISPAIPIKQRPQKNHFPTSFIHIPRARIGRFTLSTRNKRHRLFSSKAPVMHLVFLNLAKTLASPKISGILIAIASKSIMNSAAHALANRCPAQRQTSVRAITTLINSASATAMPVGSEASRT